MGKREPSRDGRAVVEDLGGGRTLCVTMTPAGLRANLSEAGSTRPVDPRDYGISGLKTSAPGGGARRVTILTTSDQAIDVTRSADGNVDEVVHDGSSSRKR